jgi:tRNA(Arg) A34 adenosine deaminase TadA
MSAADLQRRFLELAISEAIAGVQARDGGPFGAVVVQGGRAIARAHNRVTSRPDPTAHAEVEAIRDACRELRTHSLAGCELYSSCEPCPMCLSAIHWARIGRVYYAATRADAAQGGFDDARLHEQLLRPDADPSFELIHVPGIGGEAPFAVWARLEGRTLY